MHLQQVAYGEVNDPLTIYRGKDCVEKFCEYIRQEAHRLYNMFPEKLMDPLTKKQLKLYENGSRCHICFKQFNSNRYSKTSEMLEVSSHFTSAVLFIFF